MELKTCSSCNLPKSIELFPVNKTKKDGHDYVCKECKKLYNEKYHEKNRQKLLEYKKSNYIENKIKYNILSRKNRKDHLEERKLQDKIYYETHKEERKNYLRKNKDKLAIQNKIYREKNKEKRNNYIKIKCKTDPLFKLRERIKCSIRQSFKKNNLIKECNTTKILGCSIPEFRIHLESKFESWMSWNNYGSVNGNPPTKLNQCWDIDHIIPTSSANTEGELIKLNHYTNLQPLCSYINRNIKKDKY